MKISATTSAAALAALLGAVSIGAAHGANDDRGAVRATIDDSVITTKVKAQLLADKDVKGTDIAVETVGGEVMLSGFVDNQRQVDRAVEIARAIDGVKKVTNKMSVKSARG